MVSQIESVMISSPSAKKLAAFYRDVVGLKVKFEGVMGPREEEYYELAVGKGSGFSIIDYSKVKGKAKDPNRIILNFEVDDIKGEVARMKRAKVKLVKDTFHMEGYGYIAAFADVDGNYFQLAQVRATPKKKR